MEADSTNSYSYLMELFSRDIPAHDNVTEDGECIPIWAIKLDLDEQCLEVLLNNKVDFFPKVKNTVIHEACHGSKIATLDWLIKRALERS